MNENKIQNTLIWIILGINALTLILIITLTVIGWDVITQKADQPIQSTKEEKTQTQQPKQTPTGAQQQIPANETTQGKCGDNTCDAIEKANPNVCPQDCE